MLHLKDIFSTTERTIITIFGLVAILSLSLLLYKTYLPEDIILRPDTDVYTEVFNKEMSPLNPLFVMADSPEDDISSFIFSSLMKHDPYTDSFKGDLAKSWALNEQGDIYTFVIRDDVLWHDGQSLTMEDVLYTLWLLKDQRIKTRWVNTFNDVKITKISDNKIRFKLKFPDTFFIENFTFPILPKHLLENVHVYDLFTTSFNKQPIGSGPYSVQSVQNTEDYSVVNLISNDKYYGDKPNIKRLTFQFILDKDSFKKNMDNAKAIFGNSNMPAKQDNEDFNKYSLPTSYYNMLFFNSDSEVTKNVVVRQAIYNYLKQDEEFRSQVSNSILVDNLFGDIANLDIGNEKDPKELLYSVGWQTYTKEFSDGIRRNIKKEKLAIKLVTVNKEPYMSIADAIKNSLKKLGIEVLHAGFSEREISYDFLMQKSYDLLFLGVKVNNQNDLFSYLHSTQSNVDGGLNLAQYKNLEMDLLLEDLRNSTDKEYKMKVEGEIIKRLNVDVPFIFISQEHESLLLNKQIEGYVLPLKLLDSKDRYYNFQNLKILQN